MKRILAWFRRRWVLSSLKLFGLIALVWSVGPYIAFAGWEPFGTFARRGVVTLILTAVWALNWVRVHWTERQKNKQLADGLLGKAAAAQPPGQGGAAAEVRTLRLRLEEALQTLKTVKLSEGGRWGNYLYQLPWYVFIGPPGSGKTTALKASGLRFPLEERIHDTEIKGVGGTRDCDWMFAEEAVLLDTAGRYVTQDSESEVDRVAWLGFLELLQKYRPRQPINGIFVAVSIGDLLQSEQLRREHAHKIKQRILELYENLGIRVPVYLIFTKTDLIAGFDEFFGNLRRADRAQVWGMTFPLEAGKEIQSSVSMFSQEFEGLEQSLNARLLERLQEETPTRRRDLLYTFPQEFSAVKATAQSFLESIFEPSRFEEPFMLRGVYFTSGTQEGSPIDRMMGGLADAFGISRSALPAPTGHGKSFFLERLLRNVIFEEVHLAGTKIQALRKGVWVRRIGYSVVAGVATLTLAAWAGSYVGNRNFVRQVERDTVALDVEARALEANQTSVIEALPSLNSARAIVNSASGSDSSLFRTFGLNQGAKLNAGALRAYDNLLTNAFLPRLMLRIEKVLRTSVSDLDELRDALEVYLMLDEPDRFDGEVIQNWVVSDWQANLPRSVTLEQRAELETHLQALMGRDYISAPISMDERLIARSQELLGRIPLAERIYRRARETAAAQGLPMFRVSEAAGPDAPRVFERRSGLPLSGGLPGVYTKKGYEAFRVEKQRSLAEVEAGSWILGGNRERRLSIPEKHRLNEDVQKLYVSDFIMAWINLLSDVTIVPFTSLAQAVEVLEILSGSESPLTQLLDAVADETVLAPALGVDAVHSEELADGFWGGVAGKLRSVIPSSEKGAGVEQPATLDLENGPHPFERLRAWVGSVDGKEATPEEILDRIRELYIHLHAIASAEEQGHGVPPDLKSRLDAAAGTLEREARRQPPFLGDLVRTLAHNSQVLTDSGISRHLNTAWASDVLPFYRQAIAERYPLVRSSEREVTLDDFARFFGAGGVLDSFFQQHLKDMIDTSRPEWQLRPGRQGVDVSPATLAQLQRADAIRKSFFSAGGSSPVVQFELKPIALDSDVSQFMLELDGQQNTYSHGPRVLQSFQWPGAGEFRQARIEFTFGGVGGRRARTEDGPWSWFRLLDQSEVQGTSQPERFIATFEVRELRATYEIRARSAFNPFRTVFLENELEEFRCPPTL